jgi:predicted deacylase
MTPMSTASLISADVDFDKNGYQSGHLRLPYSHDRSGYGHIPIPIAVLRQGPGPTVLLTGGNHGDEYEGPVALMKLMRRMPNLAINGRLIVVPGLNFPALLNGSRTSPIDGGNLNRVFPGKRNGTLTEMIAHYIDTVLFPEADFVFDIHAGGLSTNYLPTVLAYPPVDPERRSAYRKIVEAFDAPRVLLMDLLGEDRTYGAAVERHGTFFMCGEFGGHATCGIEGTRIVEQGLERLLGILGITGAKAVSARQGGSRLLRVEGTQHYLFASVGGIFEPTFALGDEVRAGQLAGRIHDPRRPNAAPADVHFEANGLAICIRTLARVEAGDCLGHLASDTDWA